MKRFIFYCAVFLLPVFIVVLGLEFLLRHIPNDYSYKSTYLDENSDKIQTLFLGSSHAFYDIDPQYLQRFSFNAAHVSQTLDLDYEILLKYKNNYSNLKNIVVPVSYFSLFEQLGKTEEFWRLKNYLIYYNIHTTNRIKDYSELLSHTLEINIERLDKYYFHGKDEISCSTLGFGLKHNSKDNKDLIISGPETAKRHTYNDLSLYAENLQILSQIIEFAKERHIRVIVFTPPAFNTYVKNLDTNQLNITIKAMLGLDEKYNNCVYLNMLTNSTFTAIDFYDSDHLNEIGAKKFTIKMDGVISKYWK